MYKLKLGVSLHFSREDFYERLQEAVNLGFDAVDFDIAGFCSDRNREIENYRHLEEGLDAVKKSGLYLNGVHISFSPSWNFAAPNEEDRAASVQRTKEVFSRLDQYAPFCYIIHGSLEPIPDAERDIFKYSLRKSLSELSAATKRLICVETLPRTCLLNTAKEACEIIDDFPEIGICADVNHFLKEKAESALLKMGDRVKTLHISDFDYVDEKHWMPKRGKIDFMNLLSALEKIGYSGVFNYEVVNPSLREIKENYEELFAEYNKLAKK